MAAPRAVVFDLGGTLVHWPDWDEGATVKWSASYDHLIATYPERRWPAREAFVGAMREAEASHWERVDREHWSGPPTGLVREGFDRLGVPPSSDELMAAMDGYARAISGWGKVFPDARDVLVTLRERGYFLVGLDSTGDADLGDAALRAPLALVLGAEGKGLRQLTRTTCDQVARLDLPGRIKSLNVSNAAALALYVATKRAS